MPDARCPSSFSAPSSPPRQRTTPDQIQAEVQIVDTDSTQGWTDAHHSPLPAPRTESPRAPDLASPLVVWPAAAEAKLDGSCVGILDDGDNDGVFVDNVLARK